MTQNHDLRALPGVGDLLERADVIQLIDKYGRAVVKHAVQEVVERARAAILDGTPPPNTAGIIAQTRQRVAEIFVPTLKKVINATGVILHTNLGRAPLGKAVADEVASVALGYSNLEFDLANIKRDDRNVHLREMLKFLTGAEDVLVVNNNAAGIVLSLSTLAAGREVIISRGEMIEIGGSFRIPEIMAASGARVVEVGTTNRTRLSDYEAAIGADTALIFKAHKSNYCIKGFSSEVHVKELVELAHAHRLPMMFDIGSGLLHKPESLPLQDEPDVRSAVTAGADVVAFSCDKLLGGPQAGIVLGRAELISRMAHAPLMRAFRVGKLTLAALGAACRQYCRDKDLVTENPTLGMLSRTPKQLKELASILQHKFERLGISTRLVESTGQCGGGALPGLRLRSLALEVLPQKGIGTTRETFAEYLYGRLVEAAPPILAILREGRILFDLLTLFEDDMEHIAQATADVLAHGGGT